LSLLGWFVHCIPDFSEASIQARHLKPGSFIIAEAESPTCLNLLYGLVDENVVLVVPVAKGEKDQDVDQLLLLLG